MPCKCPNISCKCKDKWGVERLLMDWTELCHCECRNPSKTFWLHVICLKWDELGVLPDMFNAYSNHSKVFLWYRSLVTLKWLLEILSSKHNNTVRHSATSVPIHRFVLVLWHRCDTMQNCKQITKSCTQLLLTVKWGATSVPKHQLFTKQ